MVSTFPPPPSQSLANNKCAVYVSLGKSRRAERGTLTLERDAVSISAPGLPPRVITPRDYDVLVVGGSTGTLKIGVFPTSTGPTATGSSAALYLHTAGQNVGHRVIRWVVAMLVIVVLLVVFGVLIASADNSYLLFAAVTAVVAGVFAFIPVYMRFMSRISKASPAEDVLAVLAAAGFNDVSDREVLAKHVPQKTKHEKRGVKIFFMALVAFLFPIECLIASIVVVMPATEIAPEQWKDAVSPISMIIGIPLCAVVLYRPSVRFLLTQSRKYEPQMEAITDGIPGAYDPVFLRPGDVWASKPTPKSWWIAAGGIVLTWWIGIAVARLLFADHSDQLGQGADLINAMCAFRLR